MIRKNRLPYVSVLIGMCLLILAASYNVQAQEVRSKTGFGYYNPQIGGEAGNIFYTDISLKLPTDLFVGVGFGLSDVFTSYGDEVPLFEGFRTIRNYYHLRLLIDKEIDFSSNSRHTINLGTGLTYIQLRYAEPVVFLNQTSDELMVGIDESNRMQDDAGFLLHADYEYRIGKFTIGFRSEIHLLFDIGLGGVVISPQISIRF